MLAEVPSVHPPGAITDEGLPKAIWVPHIRYRQQHIQDISLTLRFFSKAINSDENWVVSSSFLFVCDIAILGHSSQMDASVASTPTANRVTQKRHHD